MNGKANIHFKDGKKIEKADKYEYLGGTITPNASRNAEISSHMSKALGTCKKLSGVKLTLKLVGKSKCTTPELYLNSFMV